MCFTYTTSQLDPGRSYMQKKLPATRGVEESICVGGQTFRASAHKKNICVVSPPLKNPCFEKILTPFLTM